MFKVLFCNIITLIFCWAQSAAQNDTIYLDKDASLVKKGEYYEEYAVIQNSSKTTLVNFYSPKGTLLRSCQYETFNKDFNHRVLYGLSYYKYSESKQDSLIACYTENMKNGAFYINYPDGNLNVCGFYKENKLDGLLKQFYENGKLKRIEYYKDNKPIQGKYLSSDSTELAYIPYYKPAEFKDGKDGLLHFIARNLYISNSLAKSMHENNQNKVKVMTSVTIDATGYIKNYVILHSDNPLFDAACLATLKKMRKEPFTPGEIEGIPSQTELPITFICYLPFFF